MTIQQFDAIVISPPLPSSPPLPPPPSQGKRFSDEEDEHPSLYQIRANSSKICRRVVQVGRDGSGRKGGAIYLVISCFQATKLCVLTFPSPLFSLFSQSPFASPLSHSSIFPPSSPSPSLYPTYYRYQLYPNLLILPFGKCFNNNIKLISNRAK